uniref:Uncharacterized protein n=1 Tax=Glossina austeni TaxID=7395 RepID=A0A1A9UDB4_GLOAU
MSKQAKVFKSKSISEFRHPMTEEISTSETKKQDALKVYTTGELKNSAPNDSSSECSKTFRSAGTTKRSDIVGVVDIDFAVDKSFGLKFVDKVAVTCLDVYIKQPLGAIFVIDLYKAVDIYGSDNVPEKVILLYVGTAVMVNVRLRRMPPKWSVFSAAQNLPAVLNDPGVRSLQDTKMKHSLFDIESFGMSPLYYY